MAETNIKVEDGAGGSSRVKTELEKATASQDPHEHGFAVKFESHGTYNINCDQPCTVLQAIKTLNIYNKAIQCAGVNVIIQRGTGDDESIVPTHFPCSCIRDGEVLTISSTTQQVEEAKNVTEVHPKDHYSVFYIDTKGGPNVMSIKLFRNKKVEKFKYLCVYGKKEITVKEALEQDGRFTDHLDHFELINITDDHKTECTCKIKKLHNKKFKICRSRGANAETNQQAIPGQQKQQNPPCASTNAQRAKETRSVLDVAQQKGISLKTAITERGSSIDCQEVYDLLCQQFPRLKRWMESRFSGNSFQEAFNLRKKNFGKIQQSFSEVHKVRELVELSESVCLLEVPITDSSIMQGTGFVLFDNFVLTNAHLFKYWVKSTTPNWHETLDVTAVFNFEKQGSERNKINAKVLVGEKELDYAILQLKTESQELPGLLKKFGPVPSDGEACVVGHPGGGVKKMDPTCVIEKERREEAVNTNLECYKKYFITVSAVNQVIKNDPYENIYVTYNTFMYHGSSGSPVFDAHGQVFGLHSGGFFFGFPKPNESVLEFAFPLLTIFENFVGNLKKDGWKELLERVEEEAKGNPHLENIIASVVGPKQGIPEALLEKCSDKMECN